MRSKESIVSERRRSATFIRESGDNERRFCAFERRRLRVSSAGLIIPDQRRARRSPPEAASRRKTVDDG
jgi:hypothetical protein